MRWAGFMPRGYRPAGRQATWQTKRPRLKTRRTEEPRTEEPMMDAALVLRFFGSWNFAALAARLPGGLRRRRRLELGVLSADDLELRQRTQLVLGILHQRAAQRTIAWPRPDERCIT